MKANLNGLCVSSCAAAGLAFDQDKAQCVAAADCAFVQTTSDDNVCAATCTSGCVNESTRVCA